MKNILIHTACCLLLVCTGCGHEAHHKHETISLAVSKPLRKETEITREHVCQIHSIQHIELRALEKGYVQDIHVDEGQMVEKGTLLFEVMPRLYKAEYMKAKAEVDAAQIEYENTEQLRKKNIVALSELKIAKAKLDKATAELALAQVHLDFTQIKAPFDGIMGRLHVRNGSLVEEGELLTTLSDNHNMWVYFNVPEAEYLELQRGTLHDNQHAEVELRMANNETYKYPGTITAIEADFNNETGNIAFRATFPNPEDLLRHGQTGNVILKTPVKDALLIPQKATFEILDKRYVFVVDKDDKVHPRAISVVAELPDLFLVGEELSEEDTILIDGLRKVRDGSTIHPQFIPPKTVVAQLKVYAE